MTDVIYDKSLGNRSVMFLENVQNGHAMLVESVLIIVVP